MHWRTLWICVVLSNIALQAIPPKNWERPTPTASSATIKRANQALNDQFTLQGVIGSPIESDSQKYNWDANGPKNDKEWAWFLNRHRYFEDLYVAYNETADARYAEKIFQILEDWIAQNKMPPSGMSFSSAWRPLEAARRILESWDIVYLKLWDDPLFPEALKPQFLEALENHGDYLQNHHALYGNHLITEMLALLKLSLLMPEAENSSAWENYALTTLDKEYTKQVYPEGAHKELSSHYQRVVALNFQSLLKLLEQSDKQNLTAVWKPKVEELWRYFAAIQKPSGFAPINNDSDRENVRALLSQNGYEHFQSPETTTYFPNAGQVIFRANNPSNPPLWAFFDIGPRGSDHQHEDFLHLSLSYGEFDLLTDNGRYTYQPGPWRDYFKGPRSHNILLIDGKASRPKPNVATVPLPGSGYLEQDGITAAWGTAEFKNTFGSEIAYWQRITLLLPNCGILILDQIITFQHRNIQGFWHSSPENKISLHDSKISFQKGEQLFDLTSLNTAENTIHYIVEEGSTDPEIQGWHSYDFNQKQPAPTLAYSTQVNRPTTFAWLFSPSEENGSLISISENAKTLEINYQSNQRSYYLNIVLPDSRRSLTINDFQETVIE